jgi:hypothetical protein
MAGTLRRVPLGRAVVMAAGLAAVIVVGGCAGSETIAPQQKSGLGCVDDSAHCIAERGTALKGLMADKSRGWVKNPPTTSAYASGVRLWALKQKKRELSCDELSHGRREADGAAPMLRGSGPSGGLTPAQISRGIMLAQDVSKELGTEFGRRCRA